MGTGKGQEKLHTVRRADGTEEQWTQQQWRERDKSAGDVRVEEDGTTTDEDVNEEPEVAE